MIFLLDRLINKVKNKVRDFRFFLMVIYILVPISKMLLKDMESIIGIVEHSIEVIFYRVCDTEKDFG